MKTLAIVFAAALCATGAGAAGHLYPDESAMADGPDDVVLITAYDRLVVSVLKDGFAPDVTARVFIGGSTVIAEHLVGIRGGKDHKRLFSVWPSDNLFAMAELEYAKSKPAADPNDIAQMQAERPASVADIKEEGCDVPIDAALASDLATIWDIALRGTRYESRREIEAARTWHGEPTTETISTDSATLRFSDGSMTGSLGTSGGDPTGLSHLVDTMSNVCTDGGKGLAELRREASGLRVQMEADEKK